MIALQEILATKEPKVGSTRFIAIDGRGGSGKSTLASLVASKLGAEVVHTDDFAGWDNPLDWWSAVVKKVFKPISGGASTISYQPASWWEDHHPAAIEHQPVTPVMILEGVGSARSEFDDYLSVRIYVETPKHICLKRGVERDLSTGKSVEELTTMWEEWLDAEGDYFLRDNPKTKTDLVLDGSKSFEEQVAI